MFKTFNRVNEGVPIMLAPISQYLRQQGASLMAEGSVNSKNAVQLIQVSDSRYATHVDRYANANRRKIRTAKTAKPANVSVGLEKGSNDLFLEKSFKKDQRFRRMIAADFEYFFNLNKRAPELLSLFIDEQLKNGNKNLTEQQINTTLAQSMTLFRYLHEKDVFERFYKHHLARRLLASRTTPDESEKAMLSKLRHECGYSYTSKLEGMYRDILVSATFNDKFRDFCFQSDIPPLSIDLSVQVLTTGFWPMPPATANVHLPNDIQKGFLEFRKLYLDTHNGRQLSLQNNLGTAEMSAEFYGAPAINEKAPIETSPATAKMVRRHILQVTTYQMCVLMLFNQQPEWSYQDILTASAIPEKDLKRTIATLSTGKIRILLKLGGGKFTAENATCFIINDSFYSPLYKVKVNSGVKLDFKEEQQDEEMREAKDKLESDRRHEVDAAIIRIMKGRQQLDHSELVAELNVQLRHRFTPTMDMVKKSIEGLIAKDYLSRTDENRSIYRYVA
ncbi:Cullin-3-B [Hypsibius exemplaris]|uniref:Cullin-3-B n=1 Tax=Hypsibius exemplaris TaxID=2072580 RepID=A0A1W0WR51_HYPEX|nr:Cullin-3-B [Hypsibius exemplaris]